MRRVAAIDCGTNSIRLLIADVDVSTGELVDIERRMEIVRLGQGVDRTREFAAEALDRTLGACREFARLIRASRSERVRFVATSATRDARNRNDFIEGVRAALGVDPEVLSGNEEAALSFAGATHELVAGADASRIERPPFLVVDIGGGSTEFVLGGEGAAHTDSPPQPSAVSVDIGCVRLTERYLADDPPDVAQVAAAQEEVDAAIRVAEAHVPLAAAQTVVGLAGSVTTVAAMALRLPRYDPARIHHSRIAADQVHEVAHQLLTMPRSQRAGLPFMHPGRVDVIGAGALILSRVVDASGASSLLVSEHDILDGIAFSIA